jgi:hypothetical protein
MPNRLQAAGRIMNDGASDGIMPQVKGRNGSSRPCIIGPWVRRLPGPQSPMVVVALVIVADCCVTLGPCPWLDRLPGWDVIP